MLKNRSNLIKFLLCVIICSYKCKYADPYPTGAPVSRCEDMLPGHKVDPITDKAPFEISCKPNNSTGGFEVTISSPDSVKFKGFLLEARAKWDGVAIGKWYTENAHTKTLNCFGLENSGVTHNWGKDIEGTEKKKGFSEVTFNWIPPISKKLNRVKFIATVVERFDKVYLNVSNTIKLKSFKKVKLDLN